MINLMLVGRVRARTSLTTWNSPVQDGTARSLTLFNINNKHIDASVKERPQTLLVPSEEICKRDLCHKHILTPFIVSNRQTLFVRRENAFCKFHTFFGFVYHVSCLP